MPAPRWPIPGRRAPGAATSRSACKDAQFHPAARQWWAEPAAATAFRAALRRAGHPWPPRLDHDFRRRAAPCFPGGGAACRRQAAAEGQWLCRSPRSTPSPTRPLVRRLADFRKKMNFADRDGNDELFGRWKAKPPSMARRRQGYTVCNDYPERSDRGAGRRTDRRRCRQPRGWWTVAPGGLRPRHHHAAARKHAIWLLGRKSQAARRWSAVPSNSASPPRNSRSRAARIAPARGFTSGGFARVPDERQERRSWFISMRRA